MSDSVKVAIRIRPLVELEKNRGCQSIVHKTQSQPQVVVNSGTQKSDMFTYTYNYVFSPEHTQEMLYENSVKSMVMKLFDGYNVTILAYGQTGSGKTHTMGTTFNGEVNEEMGVIPRAVNDIFDKIDTMKDNHDFYITCQFVELYKEKLFDLLSPNGKEQSVVDIKEKDGKVVVTNVTKKIVKSPEDTTKCLMDGSTDRAVGATAMNSQSSRSHAIFTITIQKVPKENPSAATTAEFNLVDLAGSERSNKTGTTGEQFKEGVNINKGLLALGNVINALNGSGHVNYRDSKLTRMLQDSLGGNSITLMIACVSPADYNCAETLSTLRYADNAKRIKNKPIVNEDPKMAEINQLKGEIQSLRVQLLSKSGVGLATIEKCKKCDEPPTKMDLLKENREMAEKMQVALFEMAHRENVLTEYEETIESLNGKIKELKQQIIDLDRANTVDMSPDELKEYEDKVHMVTATILDLTEHMKERNDCIVQNSKPSQHSQSFNGSTASIADSDELAQNNDKYIKQQTEYQQELREVKQELDVKEKLHFKLIENYEKFRSLNDEQILKSKMSEYEQMIAKLEKEHEELKASLRNKNSSVSVKLAEERRKRVQQLESQIADYRQKNKVQAQLLKQHEKDDDQIKKLSSEITEMKRTKIQLIKKMKAESDEFRVWKAQREKELVQLRTKERKMQSEAVKKDLLHEKQRIVLQRKFEESTAANKRLKEALLKVRNNKESKLGKGTSMRTAAWLREEIEVITSIVDIKQSYEQLLETRAELTGRLIKVKKQKPPNTALIKQIEEQIEMHNAQITELRGKISENDLDAKIKAIQDGYQSLPESRTIVRHFFNYLIENRNSYNTYFAQARDLKHACEVAEEEKKQMAKDHQKVVDDLKKELEKAKTERNQLAEENLEKQSVLLKAMTSEGSQSAVIELLQQQLSEQAAELEQLKQLKMVHKRPIRPLIENITFELNDTVGTENGYSDDETMDPDWVKTPKFVQPKRKNTRSISHDSTEENESKASRNPRPASKRSKNGCGCKTGCKEGHCGCRKNGNGCSDSCACQERRNCTNAFGRGKLDSSKRERSSDDDDVSINNNTDNKENFAEEEEIPCTPPKKLRAEDVINPYVYSHKKRNPIFIKNSEQ